MVHGVAVGLSTSRPLELPSDSVSTVFLLVSACPFTSFAGLLTFVHRGAIGNVWRFPSLSVEYGGGAFFIPYLMALFILGIPLAILEIGFGQYFQTGDIGVFGGFHPRLRGVGLSSVACGFM